MKECLNAVAETSFDGKRKDERCEKNQTNPNVSFNRKSEILAGDVPAQLDISVTIDQPTDVTDNAQI